MNQDLKKSINDVLQACDNVNEMIFPDDESGHRLADEVKADLFWFVAFLTLSDDIMTSDELAALNEYFGTEYTTDDIAAFSEREGILDEQAVNSVPLSINYLIRIDNMFYNDRGMVTNCSATLIELYKKLGMEFICCDKSLDMNEYKQYNEYISMLEDFAQSNLDSQE